MKIEMGKKYKSKNGEFTAEALCVDLKSEYPCVMRCIYNDQTENVIKYTVDGFFLADKRNDERNLIEVSPYADFKIDDKVIVWNNSGKKYNQYFAGLHEDGSPMTFLNGATSFSNITQLSVHWDNCELYHAE